jgi:TP901 family phage tail tape measure protein
LSRIDLNVVATGNFGQLEGQLARLKAQIATINSSMATAGVMSPTAISSMQRYSDLMAEQLRSTGMFQTKMVSLTSETENFGRSLERGNLRLGEYFRNATGYIKNQQTEIQKLAREQVRLQNSMTMATGDGRAMVITPTGVDEAIHKQQILNQEYRIFRQVVAGGSTQLINWGKNTQWAGRQLTVGLTVPLTLFGAAAAQTFMEADKQLTRLVKVYGDASKGIVNPAELQQIRAETLGLAKDIAANMGVAAEETLGIAADIASTGKQGNELLAATNEAMRLSVLGEVDRQEAMRATLSIQSVFKKDTEGLAESINFLNAVENQTSTTLNDLVTGIVKAGPVVQGLGGDIEDLALMMVAMREGGVPASEAANAIKSSLASLINPTKQTTATLNEFGVDLVSIVDKNAGDVIGTLIDLQDALSGLDELSRQRAIEQIFGKFQFSRINALLSNLGKAGSQTQQVLALAGLSAGELAENADRELKAVTESVTGRFQRALASVQANLIPIGETFTEVGTLILNVASKILEIFNGLPGPVQTFLKGLMYFVGLAGPIIMITGVLGNFLGYLLKGVSSFMALKKAGRGVFEYFTPESVAARNASELITQSIYDETTAVNTLTAAIEKLSEALNQMAGNALEGGTALSGMQAGTMAAAEASAAAASGRPVLEAARSGHTYKAGEISHILPESKMSQYGFSDIEKQLLLSPGTLLGAQDFAAKRFQSRMGAEFAAEGYYDPSSMGSRQEALYKMSGATPGSGTEFDLLIKSMDEQMMARLYPTMEEHTASVAKYQVSLEQLFKKSDGELENVMQQIKKAISEGNMDEAARILRQNIDLTDDQLSAAITKKAQEYRSHFDEVLAKTGSRSIATEQTAAYMAGTEKEMLATAPERGGFAQTGSRMKRQGSAMAIMALAEDLPMSEELTAASSRRVKALNALAAAEENLRNQEKQLERLSREEVLAARRKLKDLDMEHAFAMKNAKGDQEIYVKEQGLWKRVYASGIKKELTDAKLIAQLEQRVVAEKRVTLATRYVEEADKKEALASQQAAQADIEETNASRAAARADLAEGAAGAGGLELPGMGGKGRGGKMAMMGGGALSALGMATMFLPTGEPGSGMEQASSVIGGVATGAGMGAMVGSVFPGIGTAIGAAVGGILGGIGPVINIFSTNAENAAKAVEQLRLASESAAGKLGSAEQAFLGISLKELEDIPLEAFGQKTAEAQSQLDGFVEALTAAKDAEEDSIEKTRIGQISQMSSAEELINSSMFQSMIAQAAMGGANKDQIELMLQGYLDVADKEFFSDRVKEYLDSTIPDDASAKDISAKFINNLASTADSIAASSAQGGRPRVGSAMGRYLQRSSEFEQARAGREVMFDGAPANLMSILTSLQGNAQVQGLMASGELQQTLQQYATGQITADQIKAGTVPGLSSLGAISGMTINGQSILEADPDMMMQILSSLVEITALAPDVSVLKGEVDQFNQSTKATAESLTTLIANSDLKSFQNTVDQIDFSKINTDTITELEAQLRALPGEGPKIADFFSNMLASGVDLETALKALKLAMSGTVTDLDDLASRAKNPITFEIYYKTFTAGAPVPAYTPTGLNEPIEMPGVSDLVSAATSSSGGGGGGSADTSAIEDAYDKQIEKQDKLIEKIQEEREERQKLLDLEKQAFDFAMKEQDLKNQIARARAEGRTAEAAMLQAQLDNARATNKEQETERARREREDKRIERAEKRKEELAKAKEIALEEARGGGGGGGGGMSEEERRRIEQRAQFLQEQLSKAITKFDVEIETAVLDKGLAGFFDSEPVKQFRDEMVKLGVPVQQVNEYLDTVFDGFIEKTNLVTTTEFKKVKDGLQQIGFEGERLDDVVGNAFAILQDDNLTDTEKIDLIADAFYEAGMDAGEAETAARRFYRQVGESGDVSSRISAIADSWKRVGDNAEEAAMLQALAGEVAADPTRFSPDVVEGRIGSIRDTYATGGYIIGPGTSTSDSIPVRLSNGEYVVRASMVDKYGLPFLEAINKGVLPSMASGGMISRYPSVAARMSGGGYVYRGMAAAGLVNGASAEYNINVNVETNASADDIANKVMQSLQRRDKMNRAGIRI